MDRRNEPYRQPPKLETPKVNAQLVRPHDVERGQKTFVRPEAVVFSSDGKQIFHHLKNNVSIGMPVNYYLKMLERYRNG